LDVLKTLKIDCTALSNRWSSLVLARQSMVFRAFLKSHIPAYCETSVKKHYAKFFAEFPENDAFGDLTDLEDQPMLKVQQKCYDKEQVAV
jgi:hypothetical protein